MNNDTHRNENIQTLKYSVEQFDKSITFIASGALGISFAFITDVIPDLKTASGIWLIMISWYLFTAVIFVSLICHYRSMVSHKWAVENTHLDDNSFNKELTARNKVIRWLNQSMIGGLFLAMLFLIIFINTNIYV